MNYFTSFLCFILIIIFFIIESLRSLYFTLLTLFVYFLFRKMLMRFFPFLNSSHPNVKFTFEREKNNKLAFLDICINKTNHSFGTSISWKLPWVKLGYIQDLGVLTLFRIRLDKWLRPWVIEPMKLVVTEIYFMRILLKPA